MYPSRLIKRHKSSSVQPKLINQKDYLKNLVTQKLQAQYSHGKELNKQIIDFYINDIFHSNQITERTIQELKGQIQNIINQSKEYKLLLLANLKEKMANSMLTNSLKLGLTQSLIVKNRNDSVQIDDKQSCEIEVRKNAEIPQQLQNDKINEQLSVYAAEKENDDEWTAIIRFNRLQYEKEKEMEKKKVWEQKLKVKQELDKQISLQKQKLRAQSLDEIQYSKNLQQQIGQQELKENEKMLKVRQKIFEEKQMRDQQIQQELLRRKLELKKNKEMEEEQIIKIKEEIQGEQDIYLQKKDLERQKFLQIIKENELQRKKTLEELKKEKELDNKLYEDYLNTLKNIEEKRENEKKVREDRVKALMGHYSQQVLKQKENKQQSDDEQFLKHSILKDQEKIEQERRMKELEIKKALELKAFLNYQMYEKDEFKQKMKQEDQLYANQCNEIVRNQKNTEQLKIETIKILNHQHAEILKTQMSQKKYLNQLKMNPNELKLNKPILKQIEKLDKDEILVPIVKSSFKQ